jgi:hypothetical protein
LRWMRQATSSSTSSSSEAVALLPDRFPYDLSDQTPPDPTSTANLVLRDPPGSSQCAGIIDSLADNLSKLSCFAVMVISRDPLDEYDDDQVIVPQAMRDALAHAGVKMEDVHVANTGERKWPLNPLPLEVEHSWFACDPKLEELRVRLRNEFPNLNEETCFPIFVMIEDLPTDHPLYEKGNKKKRWKGKTAILVSWVGVRRVSTIWHRLPYTAL